MNPREINASWQRLAAALGVHGENAGEVPTEETGTIVSAGRLRLACSPGGAFSLLIPVTAGTRIEPDRKSDLITVRPVTLAVDGRPHAFADVRCEDDHLTEVFARVVSDILRRIEVGAGSARAVDEALAEFRKLLHLRKMRSPDQNVVVGLIGELMTLIELLGCSRHAVIAWYGANSDRQDFRAGNISVEVKTSVGTDRMKVHINGMSQLDCEPGDRLYLNHVTIERDPAGPLSVPSLCQRVAELADDGPSFEEKLEILGFDAEMRERCGEERFRLVGTQAYRVIEDFPRLVPSAISRGWPIPGIDLVTYVLDLRSAQQFRLAGDDWRQVVGDFCACL